MSYKVGGVVFPTPMETILDYERQQVQETIQRQIAKVMDDPAGNLRQMQDETPVKGGGIDLKA